MGTLADILIPLAGSISNEKALKMREACDALEAKIDIAQRGMNHAHDLISLLTDRVKELERDNLDRRLTSLERAVDVLDRQRVETLNLRVNGLESMVLELGDATKNIAVATDETLRAVRLNTGEGSTSQTGAVSHSQSGGGSDGTREPARSARIDDAGTTQDTPSPDFTVKPCPCGAPARIRQADDDWMISCTDIACDWCIGGGLYASKEDMLRAWNRRAPAAPAVDVRRLLADYWMPALESNMDNEERMTRALAAQGVKCKEVQP